MSIPVPANDNTVPTPSQKFLRAAEHGEVDKMRIYLNEGADINARRGNNDTALIIAAREGHLKAVQFLLRRKATDVSLSNNFNQTALLAAMRESKDEKIALALIVAKSPLNVQDFWGHAAAHYAAQDNRPKIITALGKAGADLKQKTRAGTTPLIYASEGEKKHEAVEALLPFDVGINAQDAKKMSALMHAVEAEDLKLVKDYLARKANIHLRNNREMNALAIAQEKKFAGILKVLKEAEAEIFKPFNAGPGQHAHAPEKASFKKKSRPATRQP